MPAYSKTFPVCRFIQNTVWGMHFSEFVIFFVDRFSICFPTISTNRLFDPTSEKSELSDPAEAAPSDYFVNKKNDFYFLII